MEDQIRTARQAKQRFLKDQLRVNGWSPEELSEFLGSRRENGLDIDVWQADELAEEIRHFKESKRTHMAASQRLDSVAEESGARLLERQTSAGSEAERQFRIIVMPEKVISNTLHLRLVPEERYIKRTFNDVYALCIRLQLEFPFYYVA